MKPCYPNKDLPERYQFQFLRKMPCCVSCQKGYSVEVSGVEISFSKDRETGPVRVLLGGLTMAGPEDTYYTKA